MGTWKGSRWKKSTQNQVEETRSATGGEQRAASCPSREKDLAWGSGEGWLCPSLRCSMGWVQPPCIPKAPQGLFAALLFGWKALG